MQDLQLPIQEMNTPDKGDPREVLIEILKHMGFDLEVSLIEEEERTLLDIRGEDAGLLIGRKGQTLDALQFILNKILGRDLDRSKPVVVDSDGYRQRRIDALVQLAHRLAEKAVHTGRVVAVNPMSAHDRRVMHMTLRETPGVTTHSEGEGVYRRLLIVPDPDPT